MDDDGNDDNRAADAADRAAAFLELHAYGRAQAESRQHLTRSALLLTAGTAALTMYSWILAATTGSSLLTGIMIVTGLISAYITYIAVKDAHRHWLGPDPDEWFGTATDKNDVLRRASREE